MQCTSMEMNQRTGLPLSQIVTCFQEFVFKELTKIQIKIQNHNLINLNKRTQDTALSSSIPACSYSYKELNNTFGE